MNKMASKLTEEQTNKVEVEMSLTQPQDSYPGPGGDVPKVIEKQADRKITPVSNTTSDNNKPTNVTPRSTRSSQNPDFVLKQRKFLNRVVHDAAGRDSSDNDSQGSTTPTLGKSTKENKSRYNEGKNTSEGKKKFDKYSPKRLAETDEESSSKKKKLKEPTKVVGGVDSYCWRCHRDGSVFRCEICPRVYHLKCVQIDTTPTDWVCPECSTVTQAENTDTRSRAMRMLTLDQLCNLLRFALNRMESHEGSDDFAKPVDLVAFSNYQDFIVKPMDLNQLRNNIKAKMYGSTEAFLADAKWIVHNSIIFNSVHSKFTNSARGMLKICRQEMMEIENCPDCYLNAHTRSSDSWFIEACRRPHVLVWAKLKGFPFWPAKAMTTNHEGLVDVRFFGAHDRAWVPVNNCFLYSKLSPIPSSNKNKRNLEDCIQELECHIKKLRDKFGRFEYPPYKTPYDPKNEDAQLSMFLPMYEAKTPGKRLRISLHQDGARKKIALKQKSSTSHFEKTKSISLEEKSTIQPSPSLLQTSVEEEILEENNEDGLMVEFPDKTKSTPLTSGENSINDPSTTNLGTPVKHGTSLGLKKVYKTPLTAAAKKCFASKDKACVKCHTLTSSIWHSTQKGALLCASCNSSKEKLNLVQYEEGSESSSSTLKETPSVVRRNSNSHPSEELGCLENESPTLQTIQRDESAPLDFTENSSVEAASTPKEKTVIIDEEKDADVTARPENDLSSEECVSNQLPEVESDENTSPTTFVITKTSVVKPGIVKKLSIVDKLHDKFLCVEEALKDTITPEDNVTLVDEVSHPTDVTQNDGLSQGMELPKAQVILHDLKNNSEIIEQLKNMNENLGVASSITNDNDKSPLNIPSDSRSDILSEMNSSTESDSPGKIDKNTKKKQSNINDVVRNLTERRSSIDEKAESRDDKALKDISHAIMLDDFNDENNILVIDEGDLSDSKSQHGKLDKNRRKGTPARVLNKSINVSGTPTVSQKGTTDKEEVSAEQSQLTKTDETPITLVLGEDKPQNKTSKQMRSVNISKSLSLSVINASSAQEVVSDDSGSDLDDPIIVESVISKPFIKPKARKTLPNPPKSFEITQGRSSLAFQTNSMAFQTKQNAPETVKDHQKQSSSDLAKQYPPSSNSRQWSKTNNSNRGANSSSVPLGKLTPENNKSTVIIQKSANVQLEEAVNKVQSQLRGVIEEMLCNMSENGSLEATVKSLQIDMERQQWKHRQDLAENKHNTDLVVMEIRASMEGEKQRALLDAKHKYEMEKEQVILETKKKQWCTYCLKEAQLYCCWNTAYCSYECQQAHWNTHMSHCSNRPPSSSPDEAVSVPVPAPRPNYNLAGQRPRQLMPPPPTSPPMNSNLYAVASRLHVRPSPPTQYSGGSSTSRKQ